MKTEKPRIPDRSHVSAETRRLNPHIYGPAAPIPTATPPLAPKSTKEGGGCSQNKPADPDNIHRHTPSKPRQYPPMKPKIGGSNKTPAWTIQEDEILSGLYAEMADGRMKLPLIAERLRRSIAGCACRANFLGITGKRGKHFRPHSEQENPTLRYPTNKERNHAKSIEVKEWHRTHPHPMAGKEVPISVRDKISASNTGKKRDPIAIMAGMKTRAANGTMAPNHSGRSWKAGWREIAGRRIYARSRWEANYARYLEWLKTQGQIIEWEHEPETFWFDKIKRGCRSYLPDFRVTLATGDVEYHETKGWMDDRSKTKIRRMAKYHPKVVLIVRDSAWFKANSRQLSRVIQGWESKTSTL